VKRDRSTAGFTRDAPPSGPRVRANVLIPIRDSMLARFVTFDGLVNQGEHFALCFGEPVDLGAAPLVRIHSECVTSVRLITNNPDKLAQLNQAGIEIIERVPAGTFLTPFNRPYLFAKAHKAGHSLDL
jgi:GTP cyclohydrolase II